MVISEAMSVSRIRDSEAVVFSIVVFRLLIVCSKRFCFAPRSARIEDTVVMALSMAVIAVDAPVPDLHRDAARVRELLRVEAEDGNVAPVELLDDRIGMLVMVVGDDQHCGRHDSNPTISET